MTMTMIGPRNRNAVDPRVDRRAGSKNRWRRPSSLEASQGCSCSALSSGSITRPRSHPPANRRSRFDYDQNARFDRNELHSATHEHFESTGESADKSTGKSGCESKPKPGRLEAIHSGWNCRCTSATGIESRQRLRQRDGRIAVPQAVVL